MIILTTLTCRWPAVNRVLTNNFFSFFSSDFPVGAEFRAVPHGSVPLPLLPVQPAGRRASQPQTPAGFRLPSHQTGHGPTGHFFSLFLPCTGNYLSVFHHLFHHFVPNTFISCVLYACVCMYVYIYIY